MRVNFFEQQLTDIHLPAVMTLDMIVVRNIVAY
jgi:hypothetical protein